MTSPSPALDLFGRPVAARKGRARQLPLPLAWAGQNGAGEPEFLVSDSNREAVRQLFDGDWGAPALLLTGPAGSGRSTLAALAAERLGCSVIDPLEQADEEAVFHAWNRVRDEGGRLLVVAASPASIDALAIPDLRTRLHASPIAEIGAPDACLTRDLITLLLVRRGLVPAQRLGSYVAARIERSYAAIHSAVAAIDAASLASGAAPGIRLARTALIEAGLYDPAGAGDEGQEEAA
jgi:hypothetical protein